MVSKDLIFKLDIQGTIAVQPKKKPRGKELTAEEKEANRRKSSERVIVEHSIGGMKVWRCIREICRSTQYDRRDALTWYAAGLHNFRLGLRLQVRKQTTTSYQTNSE
ncbi:MAG: transposase family protein [Cytophagales bacterium]